jgi:P pilus assembly chaperone PapD
MNLKAVSVGGKEVGNLTYVPPQGSVTLPLPAGSATDVKWSVINDQGGESRQFEARAD